MPQTSRAAGPAQVPGPAAPGAPPSRAIDRGRPWLLVGTGLGIAAVGLAVVTLATRGTPPAGSGSPVDVGVPGVAVASSPPGATPPLTGGGAASGGPSSPATGNGTAAVGPIKVRATSVPTWQDVLGAWHGQALAAVRNAGRTPVDVDAAASRYAVLGNDGSTLASGTFEAAVPPILEPGETGYLVAGFTLVDGPAGTVELHVEPAVSAASGETVMLRVSDLRIRLAAGSVVATGEIRNVGGVDTTAGAVGIVLLDGRGQPIAAVLDQASAGRLARDEVAAFRAAEPPSPPVARGDIRRHVAAAWATPSP